MLLRNVRPVATTRPGAVAPLDLRVLGDRVVEIGPQLDRAPGEELIHGDGRWLIPGLWDAHVHLGQWARRGTRLDLSGCGSRAEALAQVRQAVPGSSGLLIGIGYRPAGWAEPPTTSALDQVASTPTALISGDAHAVWLNTAAQDRFGVRRRDEPVREAEWFALAEVLLAEEDGRIGIGAYTQAMSQAAARGVVGVVDYEFEAGFARWPQRYAAAGVGIRVRTSTYPKDLDAAIAAGVRTGDALGDPRLRMGALKIISDGSLNTQTAACSQPYRDGGYGTQNVAPDELVRLLSTAADHQLEVSLHAIGDAAAEQALAAFEATGARGRIEHAQLLAADHPERMARLGLSASVQPAHLLDDRHVTASVWDDQRAARSFAFRELIDAGVRLEFGSDAPVSPLDPWLAIAAAVHRADPGQEAWYPLHQVSPREALAASTDGITEIKPGAVADLAVLDDDPAAAGDSSQVAARLRGMKASLTLVGGVAVHDVLS